MTKAEAKEGEAKTRVGSVVGNIKEWKVKDEQKGGRTEGGQGTVKEWIGRGDQGQAFQPFCVESHLCSAHFCRRDPG